MKYQVIARKFRPQVFEEVVGQRPIVQTLKNAIELDRIGHAYLFSGPRGVGKTTTARLLAKALNCASGPTPTPCNECASCLEISSGRSIDVLEIDAASNTGVDSIRELRENARYAPSRDRFKIFIIDEVHMLSTSAFNALLKILEEPPSHIAFIMATTEKHKLPATILSRCQQFVFRTISPAQILEHLRTIASREGVRIGDGALEYVVKAAEGSMRDAQSLLDQIIAFGGQEIGDDDVRDVLGFIPVDLLDGATDALVRRDSKALLEIIEILVVQGLNLQQFVREFLGRIRDLLQAKLGIPEKILGSPEERRRIASQAEQFSEQELIRFFDMLLRLENDLRWTAEPRFHLEVGCVKLARLGQLRDLEEVIRDLGAGPGPGSAATADRPLPGASPRPPASNRPDTPAPGPRPASLRESPVSRAGNAPNPPVREREAASPPAPAPPVEERSSFAERYARAVEAKSPATALYLGRCGGVAALEDRIEVRMEAPTVRAALDSPEHRGILEAAAAELLGKPISVSLIIGEAAEGTDERREDNSLRESARSEALVQSFLDVFRGEIAHVRSADKKKTGQ